MARAIQQQDVEMQVTFFVPGRMQTSAGADAYYRALRTALQSCGHRADAIELAPSAGEAAAEQAWQAVPAESLPVIDGCVLPMISAGMLASRRVAGLVHGTATLSASPGEHDLLRQFSRVVVTSEAVAERLTAQLAVPAERIRVVPPGAPDARRSTGSAGPGCAIISVGTLAADDGRDVLIRALARLFDLDWNLSIVTDAARDPGHAASLAALVQQLDVAANVRFAGEAGEPSPEQLWSGADLAVSTTRPEDHGMTLAEALRRGVPFVATASGALARTVGVDCGVACPPGDVDQLSKALRRMIFDRTLRADMAEAAWTRGRSLPDWRSQARAFAEALTL